MCRARRHPRRPFRVTGGTVFGATRVVKNDHVPWRTRPAKFPQ
jgi:hypothetical protein